MVYILGKKDIDGHLQVRYLFNTQDAFHNFLKDRTNSMLFKDKPKFYLDEWFVYTWPCVTIAILDMNDLIRSPITLREFMMGKRVY